MNDQLPDLTATQRAKIITAIRQTIIEQRANMPGKSDAEIFAEIRRILTLIAGPQ